MRFRNSGGAWSNLEIYSTSKGWTLTPGDGNKTVEVQFVNGIGIYSDIYSDSIILDTTPALEEHNLIITIAGSGTTSPASGVHTYSEGNIVQVLATPDSGWELSHWLRDSVNVGSTNPYTVTMDTDHSLTAVFTEIISEDTTSPTGSMVINGGEVYTASTSVTLTLSASDAESGVTQIRFRNGGESWSEWEPYSTSKVWTLPSGDGVKWVSARFKNGEGLESISYNDAIVLETSDPVDYHDVDIDQTTYVIETCSNSIVSDLQFQIEFGKILFWVTGTTGTMGFCNITIPSELMSGTFRIYQNATLLVKDIDYTETYNGTHYHFSITYEHSTHTIQIYSTTIIPELTSIILLSTFIITTAFVVIIKKKTSQKC